MAKKYNTHAINLGIRAAKVSSFITIGKGLSLIINFIMLIVIARLLGPTNYGIYYLTIAVATFIGSFGNFSIGTYLNEYIPKSIAQKKPENISIAIGDGTIAIFASGLILVIIGITFSGILSSYALHSASYSFLLSVAMFTILFNFAYSTYQSVLISLKNGRDASFSFILSSGIQIVLSVILVLLNFGAYGAILGYLSGLVFASIYEIAVIYRQSGMRFQIQGIKMRLKQMFTFSIPVTGSNIINTVVANFSVVFLGLFVLPNVVGLYGTASRIGAVIDVILGSISVVLIPLFAEAVADHKLRAHINELFYNSIYFSLLFAAPMVVYATVFARDIVLSLFGSSFGNAALYMQLISIGTLIGILSSYAPQLVIGSGNTKRILRYTLMVSAANIIALLALVPLFGVNGLIIATLFIGNITGDILYLNYIKRFNIRADPSKIKSSKITKVVIASMITGAIIFPITLINTHSLLRLALGLIALMLIYPILVVKLSGVTEKETELLSRVSRDIPAISYIMEVIINYTKSFLS